MRLRIQHPLIQADHVRRRVQQVKILQRFRQPETLHLICLVMLTIQHIVDSGVAVFG